MTIVPNGVKNPIANPFCTKRDKRAIAGKGAITGKVVCLHFEIFLSIIDDDNHRHFELLGHFS